MQRAVTKSQTTEAPASSLTWSSPFTCSVPPSTKQRPSQYKDPAYQTAVTIPFHGLPLGLEHHTLEEIQKNGSHSETKRTQPHVTWKKSWASRRLRRGLKLSSYNLKTHWEEETDAFWISLKGQEVYKEGFQLNVKKLDSRSFDAILGSLGSHTNFKYFTITLIKC